MLLKADRGKEGFGWPDRRIAEAFGAHLTTVENLRKRLVQEGLEGALERHKRQNYTRKLDGETEARLIAIACSKPPQGRSEWTLRLLADRLAGLLASDCPDADVRRLLKRLRRHQGDLFTFLHRRDVPYDNNIGGGYILSTCNILTNAVPEANARAMYGTGAGA